MMSQACLRFIVLYLLFLSTSQAIAVAPLSLPDGTEFVFESHSAKGDKLIIWIPSEAGPQASDTDIADKLAQMDIEVWRLDPVEARFLPVTQSSMDRIPATDIAEILRYAISQTNKKVFIAGTGRAAIPILRGTQVWQQGTSEQQQFGGVILISPKLFVETPDPGQVAELMPVVTQSNAPLFLLQPKQSPWFWKLQITKPALEQSGSSVYLQTPEKIRDRFYFRPDATVYEKQQSQELPRWLKNAVQLMSALPDQRRQAYKTVKPAPKVRIGKKDRLLQEFQGNPTPPPLSLMTTSGKVLGLEKYKGKVVLVNFWASWCPPCVFEMPSMQRLYEAYRKKGFLILGVNMAEDKETITTFLNTKVKVNFPILMDSDGQALKRWQVFAFPTSYVIDRHGQIRFALFGGLEWDTPDIKQKIEKLLAEKVQ